MIGDEAALVADIKRAADALGVYVEYVSQRGGKNSGTTRGCPDCFAYVNGQVLPIEVKRAVDRETHTPCGRLSMDQIVAIERREAQGVTTYVVDNVQDFARAVNAARKPAGVTRR